MRDMAGKQTANRSAGSRHAKQAGRQRLKSLPASPCNPHPIERPANRKPGLLEFVTRVLGVTLKQTQMNIIRAIQPNPRRLLVTVCGNRGVKKTLINRWNQIWKEGELIRRQNETSDEQEYRACQLLLAALRIPA